MMIWQRVEKDKVESSRMGFYMVYTKANMITVNNKVMINLVNDSLCIWMSQNKTAKLNTTVQISGYCIPARMQNVSKSQKILFEKQNGKLFQR